MRGVTEAAAMRWLVAVVLVVLLAIALPCAIGAIKRSGRGHTTGAAMMIFFAFAAALDPAKAAAIETIQKKKDIGDAEAAKGGDLID